MFSVTQCALCEAACSRSVHRVRPCVECDSALCVRQCVQCDAV